MSRQLAERGEACIVRRLPRPRARCSQDEVKLAPPYARSLAHARGGSQDEEKNLLLPPFTPHPYYLGYRDYIILFGIYMSFSRFQYELLVHTPNTDVYRRILECRFTHFAPYVALSLAPRPSPTWWTCSNSFGLI